MSLQGNKQVVTWSQVRSWKGRSSEIVVPAGPGNGKVLSRFFLLQRAAGAHGHSKPLSWAAVPQPAGQPRLSSSRVLSLLVWQGSWAGAAPPAGTASASLRSVPARAAAPHRPPLPSLPPHCSCPGPCCSHASTGAMQMVFKGEERGWEGQLEKNPY